MTTTVTTSTTLMVTMAGDWTHLAFAGHTQRLLDTRGGKVAIHESLSRRTFWVNTNPIFIRDFFLPLFPRYLGCIQLFCRLERMLEADNRLRACTTLKFRGNKNAHRGFHCLRSHLIKALEVAQEVAPQHKDLRMARSQLACLLYKLQSKLHAPGAAKQSTKKKKKKKKKKKQGKIICMINEQKKNQASLFFLLSFYSIFPFFSCSLNLP
jgi:hypothetical protein